MHLLMLFVATAAASTVTLQVKEPRMPRLTRLQVHGEQNVRVHTDGEPVFLLGGAAARVRVCLVFGWLYTPDMPHTSRCAAATNDCLCYTWWNAQSGTACVDTELVQNTTLTWYLLPQPNVTQLRAAAMLQYLILAGRWPAYSIQARHPISVPRLLFVGLCRGALRGGGPLTPAVRVHGAAHGAGCDRDAAGT